MIYNQCFTDCWTVTGWSICPENYVMDYRRDCMWFPNFSSFFIHHWSQLFYVHCVTFVHINYSKQYNKHLEFKISKSSTQSKYISSLSSICRHASRSPDEPPSDSTNAAPTPDEHTLHWFAYIPEQIISTSYTIKTSDFMLNIKIEFFQTHVNFHNAVYQNIAGWLSWTWSHEMCCGNHSQGKYRICGFQCENADLYQKGEMTCLPCMVVVIGWARLAGYALETCLHK